MRARRDRDGHLQRIVGVQHVVLPVVGPADVAGEADRGGHPRRLTAEPELLDAAAVEPELDLVRRVDAPHVADVVGLQAHLDAVFAIHREVVADRGPAARPERQILALLIALDQVQRNVVGRDLRAAGRLLADRQAADLLGGRHVALEQGRRQRERGGYVVEAVAVRRVGRNERVDVDLQVEQVADDVAVLRLVQAVEGLRTAGIRTCLGNAVQLVLEPAAEAVVGLLVGAGAGLRRHRSDAQLADHFLPQLGVLSHIVDVRGIEGQTDEAQLLGHHAAAAAGDHAFVVAGDAVPVEQRPLRGHGRGAGLLGLRERRPDRRGRQHEDGGDTRGEPALAHRWPLSDRMER